MIGIVLGYFFIMLREFCIFVFMIVLEVLSWVQLSQFFVVNLLENSTNLLGSGIRIRVKVDGRVFQKKFIDARDVININISSMQVGTQHFEVFLELATIRNFTVMDSLPVHSGSIVYNHTERVYMFTCLHDIECRTLNLSIYPRK